jgi:hypothetical protein
MQEASGANLTNVNWSAPSFLFRCAPSRRLRSSPCIVSARPVAATTRPAMALEARSQAVVVTSDRREIAGGARIRRAPTA